MQKSNASIVVITPECPLPSHHGGRVDVARRLAALKAKGLKILLVFWAKAEDAEAVSMAMPALHALADDVVVLRELGLREYILAGANYPLWVGQRALSRSEARLLASRVQSFGAQSILLDHLNAAAGLERLLAEAPLPYAYRAHNIEHRYVALQTAGATSAKEELIAFLACKGMLHLERRIRKGAVQVLDISEDDISYWRSMGESNSHWLPVIFEDASAKRLADTEHWHPTADVGYLGNLYAPNNVAGILWFIREVVPMLRQKTPDIRIRIAGAQPVPAVTLACKEADVELCANPSDAVALLRDAHVLINPVFAGSGMNVKAVEMLSTPAALVSTQAGLAGLPISVRHCFAQAETPSAFAAAILNRARPGQREAARALFSESALAPFLSALPNPPE